MNPFCLKLDFLRNRLRVICFCLLRYAFFLIVMLSGIYTPIFGLLKFRKYRSYRSYSNFASSEVIEVTRVSQVV